MLLMMASSSSLDVLRPCDKVVNQLVNRKLEAHRHAGVELAQYSERL
jgi:hypothetical protein